MFFNKSSKKRIVFLEDVARDVTMECKCECCHNQMIHSEQSHRVSAMSEFLYGHNVINGNKNGPLEISARFDTSALSLASSASMYDSLAAISIRSNAFTGQNFSDLPSSRHCCNNQRRRHRFGRKSRKGFLRKFFSSHTGTNNGNREQEMAVAPFDADTEFYTVIQSSC